MSDVRAGSVYFDVIAKMDAIRELRDQISQLRQDAAAGINIPVSVGKSGSSFSGGGGRTSVSGIDRASMLTGMTPGDVAAARMGFESFNPSGGWAAAMASRQRAFQQESQDAMLAQQAAMEDAFGGHAGISDALRKQILSESIPDGEELDGEQMSNIDRMAGAYGLGSATGGRGGRKGIGKLLNWHNYFMAEIVGHVASDVLNEAAGAFDTSAADYTTQGAQFALGGPLAAEIAHRNAVVKSAGILGGIGGGVADLYADFSNSSLGRSLGVKREHTTTDLQDELKSEIAQQQARAMAVSTNLASQAAATAETARYYQQTGNTAAAGAEEVKAIQDKYNQQSNALSQKFDAEINKASQAADAQIEVNYLMASEGNAQRRLKTETERQIELAERATAIREEQLHYLEQGSSEGLMYTRAGMFASAKLAHLEAVASSANATAKLSPGDLAKQAAANNANAALAAFQLSQKHRLEHMNDEAIVSRVAADHGAYAGRIAQLGMEEKEALEAVKGEFASRADRNKARADIEQQFGGKIAEEINQHLAKEAAAAAKLAHKKTQHIDHTLQRLQAEDERRQKVLGDQVARDNEQMIRSYGGSVDNATGLVSGDPITMAEGLFSHQGKKADKVAEKIEELKKAMAGGLQALAKALGVPVFNIGA